MSIRARLDRISRGLFGDCAPVGEGVWELRVDWGPGYRVYYARASEAILLLLCGGDKRKQQADINRAKDYWNDFKKRTRACLRVTADLTETPLPAIGMANISET